ncbi:hypothetical protein [Pseudomonas sp. EMN2]|uniref:DUF5983 family protein n=1 Tax=Pseudomonas sp. EMN2 TaxID=2615212 RepID=UPI00129BE67B|nr:hypothetical protein [Pseudomonas sp. EMN2]
MSQPETYVATLHLTVNDSRADLVEHMVTESLAHLVETKNSCDECVIAEARVVAVAPAVPGLETSVMPVISTAHLTAEVAERLAQGGTHWCPCASWPNGFFLFLDLLEDGDETVPQCLLDIRNWLRAHENSKVIDESRWVRLDADGAYADGLPIYDW